MACYGGELGSLIVVFSLVMSFRKLDCSLKLIVSTLHFIPKLLENAHLPDVQAVVDLKCEVRRYLDFATRLSLPAELILLGIQGWV